MKVFIGAIFQPVQLSYNPDAASPGGPEHLQLCELLLGGHW